MLISFPADIADPHLSRNAFAGHACTGGSGWVAGHACTCGNGWFAGHACTGGSGWFAGHACTCGSGWVAGHGGGACAESDCPVGQLFHCV